MLQLLFTYLYVTDDKKRGKRGGDPKKRKFFKQRFNPYHRNLENLAFYFSQQVGLMNKQTTRELKEKKYTKKEESDSSEDENKDEEK